MFASDAVIDDVSIGGKFAGTTGVRNYLEQFFVGYNTASRIVSIDVKGDHRAVVHLDFTGDFGHETGFIDLTINDDRLFTAAAADLTRGQSGDLPNTLAERNTGASALGGGLNR